MSLLEPTKTIIWLILHYFSYDKYVYNINEIIKKFEQVLLPIFIIFEETVLIFYYASNSFYKIFTEILDMFDEAYVIGLGSFNVIRISYEIPVEVCYILQRIGHNFLENFVRIVQIPYNGAKSVYEGYKTLFKIFRKAYGTVRNAYEVLRTISSEVFEIINNIVKFFDHFSRLINVKKN